MSSLKFSFTKYIFCLTLLVSTLTLFGQRFRPIDGFGTNLNNPQWGAVGDVQPRLSFADYADGISQPIIGEEVGRAEPRVISNLIFAQESPINSDLSLSDYVWVFGQFVDHDITLFELSNEPLMNIIVPEDDPIFIPGTVIPMMRTFPASGTGTSADNPREHVNFITAYLDLSSVYGSDEDRAHWLRTFVDGKMKVSEGNMLPWNTTTGNFNAPIDYSAPHMADDTRQLKKMYVAGDVRANENPLLIAFHTLFVREHNRLCDVLKEEHPGFNDERLYQTAREMNIAFYQNIVFNEWLPAMGILLPEYNGYNENVNPQIFNEFSTAAFRLGHTLINSNIIRMDNEGSEMKQGHISLRDAFFNPYVVELIGGIDPYFKGMGVQISQEFDSKIIDDVRNFLFGTPNQGGLDLAAININRGRERGLPDFNTIREYIGLPRYNQFDQISSNETDISGLTAVYENVNSIDAWVGMLSENHKPNSLFGETVTLIMENQFQNLRDGDRYFYLNLDFTEDELKEIEETNLHKILMRNTSLTLMQKELFKAMPHEMIEEGPELVPFPLTAAAYPNPAHYQTTIKFYSSLESEVDISLIDISGKVIMTLEKHVYEGQNYIDLDLSLCPRGLYNVIISNDHFFNTIKLIKE